jgi:glycosyltransferase involved in cell wall biosynthesis
MSKIAIVANSTWYLYNFRRRMILKFIESGFEVIVIAPKDEYVDKFRELGIQTVDVYMDKKGKNPLNDIKTYKSFLSVYRNQKIDIALQYTIKPNVYGTLAAKKCNIPVINNIAGLGTLFIKETIFTHIAKMLYRWSQRKADIVIFQNRDDSKLFLDNKIVLQNQVVQVPGSGVDLSRFKPRKKSPQNSVFTFLLIARMIEEKGVRVLVDAGKILAERGLKFNIQLLGFLAVENPSAITREQMNEWATLDFVEYLGVSDSVENIIAEADCVTLPSYYREGVPRTLLEAAAMGKPIVTTDNVGCREVVDEGRNGYKCAVKDSKALADSMEKMLMLSSEEYLNMCQYSREKMVQEFDEAIVIQAYFDCIKKIIG